MDDARRLSSVCGDRMARMSPWSPMSPMIKVRGMFLYRRYVGRCMVPKLIGRVDSDVATNNETEIPPRIGPELNICLSIIHR
jgi:hypothetical protein